MLRQHFRCLILVTSIHLLAACAAGSAIVTGTPRSPIDPSVVRIFLDSPAEFETIALVNASSDAGWTDQQSIDYAIEELKHQAAKLGANGVLLLSSSSNTSTHVITGMNGRPHSIPVTEKSITGKAIYVKTP